MPPMRLLATGMLALALPGCWLVGFDAVPTAAPQPSRTFTRVTVLRDGSIEIGSVRGTDLRVLRDAVPDTNAKHWLVLISAASVRAMGTDAAISDLCRESGWFLTADISPAAGPVAHVSDLPNATLASSGALSIGTRSVMSIDDAAALLDGRRCPPGTGIGLRNDGNNSATLFHAALRFAEAGCFVTVLQGPPGITAAPTPIPR